MFGRARSSASTTGRAARIQGHRSGVVILEVERPVITSTSQKPSHVVLLGDSIFDNAAYTHGGPDVITHLRRVLPVDWRGTLCAVDGATSRDVASQLPCIPTDASHLVVSVGGNDALQNSDFCRL